MARRREKVIDMRKLASIQKIKRTEPVEGADRIELARVLGWQCVVSKGDFHPGDLCVYFEVDSFLPVEDRYAFLAASSFRKNELVGEGFHLRTMKFRGELSQGLCMPLSRFPEIEEPKEGEDVTQLLGVKKWEIPEMATTGGTVIGKLPADVPKTDETRVQSAEEVIREFDGMCYYISTKMDGSSHSVSFDTNGFHVTGHNFEYKDDGTSSFYEFLKKRGIPERMEAFKEKEKLKLLTIQGEYCGPGIQKNRMKLKGPEWYVFTVREDGERVGLREMQRVCEELRLETVPIEEMGAELPSHYPTVESLLERAEKGTYSCGARKEGIVIRPMEPVYSRKLGAYLSLKAVSNKYLLKNGE